MKPSRRAWRDGRARARPLPQAAGAVLHRATGACCSRLTACAG